MPTVAVTRVERSLLLAALLISVSVALANGQWEIVFWSFVVAAGMFLCCLGAFRFYQGVARWRKRDT